MPNKNLAAIPQEDNSQSQTERLPFSDEMQQIKPDQETIVVLDEHCYNVRRIELTNGIMFQISQENIPEHKLALIFDQSVERVCTLTGKSHLDGESVVNFNGHEEAQEIHAILVYIHILASVDNGVRTFVVPWKGDLTELLPYSLLNKNYRAVRVSHKGEVLVNNFEEISKEQDPEDFERNSSIGFQKAIHLKAGQICDQDAEDVHVYIEREQDRKWIENSLNYYKGAQKSLLLQQLHDFCFTIALQVQQTRNKLSYLLSVQLGEKIQIQVSDLGPIITCARYRENTLKTKRDDSEIVIPLERTESNIVETNTCLQTIDLPDDSLISEIRHHIHYLNCHLLESNALTGADIGKMGTAETVDWMKSFSIVYRLISMKDDGNKITVDGLPKHHLWLALLRILTIVDSFPVFDFHKKGSTFSIGHIPAECVVKDLALRFRLMGRPLSEEGFKKVDKAVFDFLSSVRPRQPHGLTLLMERVRILRLIDSEIETVASIPAWAHEQFGVQRHTQELSEQKKTILSTFNDHQTGKVFDDINHLYKLSELVEAIQKKLPKFIREIIGETEIPDADKETLFKAYLESAHLLSDFLTNYCPYRAPDGKNYPTEAAFYLNPDVLYNEVLRRYPELARKDGEIKSEVTLTV